MSSTAKRHAASSPLSGAWLERRMADFEGHLNSAGDLVLGPSGRLLRQSVALEREASSVVHTRLEVVPTTQPREPVPAQPVQSPLLFEIPKT